MWFISSYVIYHTFPIHSNKIDPGDKYKKERTKKQPPREQENNEEHELKYLQGNIKLICINSLPCSDLHLSE